MAEIMKGDACACPHHKTVPVTIILIGLLFLLGNLNVISRDLVDIGWPILLTLAGILKLGAAKCKCC